MKARDLEKTRALVYHCEMASQTLGNALVAFLLILNGGRVFFLRHEKIDALASLSPAALVISLLQIFTFGASALSLSLLALSLFALVTNAHALVRSAKRLYVDRYSPLFIIFSITTLVCALFLFFCALRFAEVKVDLKTLGVEETKINLRGTFAQGFSECGYFKPCNATIFLYGRADGNSNGKVVVLCADKRSDSSGLRPYMAALARRGFVVAAGDFFARDSKWFRGIFGGRMMRKFSMLLSWFVDKDSFERQNEFYTFAMMKEYEAVLDFARSRFGEEREYYFASDGMGGAAARAVMQNSGGTVKDVFALDGDGGAAAPGFGCVAQTDPLVARFLGIERDASFAEPESLALKTCEKFSRRIK